MYKRLDTTYNGINDTIYQYSISQKDTLYNLSFTNVGVGNGDYIAVNDGNANGRVFKWVQPVNGARQGDWDPVILLVTPKKHDLITAAAEYAITKNSSLKAEMALSNYDVNTFSSKNKEDNNIKIKYKQIKKSIIYRLDKIFINLNEI